MKLIKVVVPWIISLALCILAVEAFGAAVFLYKNHKLVYFNADIVPAAAVEPAKYKQRLHPYFGYTGPYSLNTANWLTNSLGFGQQQSRIVPFKPEPNDFVVFVFGSSVAGNLVAPPQGGEPLASILQKLPQLKNRNVVVYSMAQGPQKQPQQLMELAFLIALGQHIDLVLNVDGTVEFTASLANLESGVDPIFPPVLTLGAIGREIAAPDTSSADYYELAARLSRDRAAIKLYAKRVTESRSGVGFLRDRFLLAFYTHRLTDDLRNYESTVTRKGDWDDIQKLLSLDMAVSATKENVIEKTYQSWLRCSDAMKVMANANGAAYVEIVHPNPYHSKKKFSSSEIAILASISEKDDFRRGSFQGLELIDQRSSDLKARGIVNATSLFDDNGETIYIDQIGHFSRLGETILGQFIADQVAARLKTTGQAGAGPLNR
jgi:hypothetical protein